MACSVHTWKIMRIFLWQAPVWNRSQLNHATAHIQNRCKKFFREHLTLNLNIEKH